MKHERPTDPIKPNKIQRFMKQLIFQLDFYSIFKLVRIIHTIL